jgi:hypothetical protein
LNITDDCIEWDGFLNEKRYGITSVIDPGRIRKDGKQRYKLERIHRLAWIEANGPILDGLCVLHKCDNPPCFNIEHLFLGTKADNNLDMRTKGRGSRGDTHGMRKLSTEQVIDMRRRHAAGARSSELAGLFDVTYSAVRLVVTGRRWRHVRVKP